MTPLYFTPLQAVQASSAKEKIDPKERVSFVIFNFFQKEFLEVLMETKLSLLTLQLVSSGSSSIKNSDPVLSVKITIDYREPSVQSVRYPTASLI